MRVPLFVIVLASCVGAGSLATAGQTQTGSPRSGLTAHRAQLTFADRVAYQRAIEEVYWHHRIWSNEGPKPALDEVMSTDKIEKKVDDYLSNSQLLEAYWQTPITLPQLQAEMDRMAKQTRKPDMLRELFAALGNDPFVIAECLARPTLAERMLRSSYGYDERIHRPVKQRAHSDLLVHSTVAQMTQTSGTYSEIELVRTDGSKEGRERGIEHAIKLDNDEWNETARKLAATFNNPTVLKAPYERIPVGVLSRLQQDETSYFAIAVIEKGEDRLKIAKVTWSKESLESWRARARRPMSKAIATKDTAYRVPAISDAANGCTDNTWAASSPNTLSPRDIHTAVWTGSEMIVWGGASGGPIVAVNTGGRYNPSTDAWTSTNTVNAPSPRGQHSAVWTGTVMIVWGGHDSSSEFNTGARYNPATDSWNVTSTTNAPTARSKHSAVWTGTEMIVWGGRVSSFTDFNTGGRYNPSTNSWTATSTTNAPTARAWHSTVWTGSEMIVWGGFVENNINQDLNSGGRYNPSTNSWIATNLTNAPSARQSHTAIWTGSHMIVWGGVFDSSVNPILFNTGGKYDPGTDTWTATSTSNAPLGRDFHTAVWTGAQMIVWGGNIFSGQTNTGGRYNPSADNWTDTTVNDAPAKRHGHTAVWTGSEMIVWGGSGIDLDFSNTGGRYCAQPSTPVVQRAVSRKSHGAAGNFDIDLPLGGTPGIECRSGGTANDHMLVVSFLANVSVNGNPQAVITSGTATVGSGGVANGGVVRVSGNVVTVPLTNVSDAQTLNVTVNGVNGATNIVIPMSVLLADTTGSGSVTGSDVSETKAKSGQSVNAANFRSDITLSNSIDSSDVTLVKLKSGTALP